MARVRLYLMTARYNPVFRFVRPSGVREAIPALRLRAFVNLRAYVAPGSQDAANATYPECILDTGAHLATVPEYIWTHFRPGAVTYLPFDPAMPVAQRAVTVGGGRYPYDLAELDVPLVDHHRGGMTVRVVAKFTRDGGALTTPMVLGLSGGFLDGRILRAEPDLGEPFGQRWTLEDP